MIVGLGTDLVQISRIGRVQGRFPQRFARRILTQAEFAEWSAHKHPERFLARRFAVKEAASKALGTGFREGLHWSDIGLSHDDLGRPLLLWFGRPAERMTQQGWSSWVSLSDEQDYVMATVILERA